MGGASVVISGSSDYSIKLSPLTMVGATGSVSFKEAWHICTDDPLIIDEKIDKQIRVGTIMESSYISMSTLVQSETVVAPQTLEGNLGPVYLLSDWEW